MRICRQASLIVCLLLWTRRRAVECVTCALVSVASVGRSKTRIRVVPQRRGLQMTQQTTTTITTTTTTGQKAVELKHVEFSTAGGDSSEPPVVILHGLLGSKRNFSSLGNALANKLVKKRRILAVDLRNHGENHHDWRLEMSYTDMALDLLALLDRRSISRAVLIGHSMGGKVAKALALSHPHRVAGLVVLDIAPVRYTDTDASWKAIADIIHSLSQFNFIGKKTKKHVDLELTATVEDPALRAFILTNLQNSSPTVDGPQEQLFMWKSNMNAIAQQLHILAGFDIIHNDHDDQQQPPTYQGDTFFINGGASRFVKSVHMPIIAQYFPNFMLTTIRGAGHWLHAEAPDDTFALLKRYLDR